MNECFLVDLIMGIYILVIDTVLSLVYWLPLSYLGIITGAHATEHSRKHSAYGAMGGV